MARGRMAQVYYITHVDNVPSILERGILSHEQVEEQGLEYAAIYDKDIVSTGRTRTVPDGRTLWGFANLFFQPRNAMLYRVLCEKSADDIVVLAVRSDDVLGRPDIFITTGNAASELSDILPQNKGLEKLPQIRKYVFQDYWNQETKRRIMAECLVPDKVAPELIRVIYVAAHAAKERVADIAARRKINVVVEPNLFFRPRREIVLTENLTVRDGDMFFSRMHTLTISVNCVGVMGKGLASRAKYQFPDVYVIYQDLCREKLLRLGRLFLHKRETPFDTQLADEPWSLNDRNHATWFLLFPTKRHWRERSSFDGIEKGMEWLRDNYGGMGIQSLALPALGCGLGWLDWCDVGPMLCRYLSGMDIRVQLYLPAEKTLSGEMLSRDFLLSQVKR